MEKLPQLKVRKETRQFGKEEIQDFEQAKKFPFGADFIIVAEGKQINSYEDLLKLAGQEKFKNKKYLDVIFLPMIVGG
jgi:hypothetical protein